MPAPALFHYSEEPNITVFEPRPSKYHDYNVVWAVAPEGAQNFLLPRECPRVTYGVDANSTPEDAQRWLSHTAASRVIAIEAGWLDRVRACTLYEYAMPLEAFEMQDMSSTHHCSRQTVYPLARRAIPDLLAEIAGRRIELRILPSLWPLRDQIAQSTLRFSIYRFVNAQAPIDGYAPIIPL